MISVIMVSFFLIVVIYMVFLFLFYSILLDIESSSSYECGFDPNSLTRLTFSYRFFLISILFMIFDVEISLMLPIPFLMVNIESLIVFFMFVLILIVGLLYEYYCGSLDWLANFVSKA